MTVRPALADKLETLAGREQLPRSNGELVFNQPWEARAFGLVVAMLEAGHYSWDQFRTRLIERIASAEDDDGTGYYRHWLGAFEDLVVNGQLLDRQTVQQRTEEVAAADRHEGHDHDH